MNNKQRAYLSGLATNEPAILSIGKAGLTPEVVVSVEEALNARELIKISVLKNCFDDPNGIARTLAERTHAEVVRVIGRKIILYRKSKTKKDIIELPN